MLKFKNNVSSRYKCFVLLATCRLNFSTDFFCIVVIEILDLCRNTVYYFYDCSATKSVISVYRKFPHFPSILQNFGILEISVYRYA